MNSSSYSYKKVKRIASTVATLFVFEMSSSIAQRRDNFALLRTISQHGKAFAFLLSHDFTNIIGKLDWILDWQAFN